jgi:MerR-like DNA binding protein
MENLDLTLPESKDTPYSYYRVKRMDERLTIGDLAKATGTKVVTVRYYEQAGLLPAPRARPETIAPTGRIT